MTAIQPIQDAIEAEAALYFLPQGHYLFRWRDESGLTGSKFVTADDLAAAFANSERDTGWLAPGIVRAGYSRQGDWFVLVQPPHKETIRLLDVGPITIPIPMLVLAGAGRSYYLWAAKEEGAFSPSCLIFDAPFPNVHAGGQICWGNNTPPNASPRNAGQAWELFFRSPFNGHLANGKTRRHKDDVRKLLAGLDGKRRFPVGQLAAPRGTLESNINRLFR
jgi:PRTRC genetic system protein B